jgi:hypothetical protein
MYREQPHSRIAQICLNGHIISSILESPEDSRGTYCSQCGKPTITECKNCNKPIEGDYYNPDVVVIAEFDPEPFCKYCGKPFPWTQAKLDAAIEIIDLESELGKEEKDALKMSLDDIISENPRSKVGALKIKRLVTKVGLETGKALRDIAIDIASETAKKILLGNSS